MFGVLLASQVQAMDSDGAGHVNHLPLNQSAEFCLLDLCVAGGRVLGGVELLQMLFG